MAGLFNKVKNKLTGKRFLVSTIKKDDNTYETAVFPANFFYLPQGFKLTNPSLVKQSRDPEEAERLHRNLEPTPANRVSRTITSGIFGKINA